MFFLYQVDTWSFLYNKNATVLWTWCDSIKSHYYCDQTAGGGSCLPTGDEGHGKKSAILVCGVSITPPPDCNHYALSFSAAQLVGKTWSLQHQDSGFDSREYPDVIVADIILNVTDCDDNEWQGVYDMGKCCIMLQYFIFSVYLYTAVLDLSQFSLRDIKVKSYDCTNWLALHQALWRVYYVALFSHT